MAQGLIGGAFSVMGSREVQSPAAHQRGLGMLKGILLGGLAALQEVASHLQVGVTAEAGMGSL